ncbi:MAG: hypothetical protein AB7E52_02570 [Bdellovibrionales bacterium]
MADIPRSMQVVIIPTGGNQDADEDGKVRYYTSQDSMAILGNELTYAYYPLSYVEIVRVGGRTVQQPSVRDPFTPRLICGPIAVAREMHSHEFSFCPLTVAFAKDYLRHGTLRIPLGPHATNYPRINEFTRAGRTVTGVFNALLTKAINGQPEDKVITVDELVGEATKPHDDRRRFNCARVYVASLDKR